MPVSSTKRFGPPNRSTVCSVNRVALLAALGLATLPAVAMAQTAQTITHAAEYPGGVANALNTAGALLKVPAKSALPLVDPRLLPPALLRQNNTLPAAGGSAPVPGAADVAPEAYGDYSPLSIAPYTTARSSASVLGPTPNADAVAITSYPWRSSGLLLFYEGTALYQCSASLIRPGLIVTAAHCVANFGKSTFYNGWLFYPAVYDNTAPYGVYTAANAIIATAYYNGTDYCYPGNVGVICNDDIAIITLNANSAGTNAGKVVGYYSYSWNGYSFKSSFGGARLASLTQFGYPVAFDGGRQQERTDGIGAFWGPNTSLKNTLLGSAQTGGSSGGPWLVNFGTKPVVDTSRASLGHSASPNTVDAVTSWGYTTVGINTVGASWFGQDLSFPLASYLDSHSVNRGAGNIGALVAAACTADFTKC